MAGQKKGENNMKTIKTFDEYNFRRYGMPWVAIVDPKTAKPDFSKDVGGYTGRKGEAGDLYVIEPLEGAVYMYGQKDYRGNNTVRAYAQYLDGEFHEVSNTDLVTVLQK